MESSGEALQSCPELRPEGRPRSWLRSDDTPWTGRGVKLGAAGFLPAGGSVGQSWSPCPERGVRARRGQGSGVASSLHRSPEKLFGPRLYLGAQLLHCKVGPLEPVGSDAPVRRFSRPRALCLLRWPPGSCTGSQLRSLCVPGCGKVSWPRFCLEVLGSPGDSDLFLGPG